MKSFLLAISVAFLLFSCASQKEKLAKKWLATEIDLAGNKLTGDMIEGVYINFKNDATYESTILGEDESDGEGTWQIKDNMVTRKSKEGKEWSFVIVSLTGEKLVLSYEDHGMQRQLTFVSSK